MKVKLVVFYVTLAFVVVAIVPPSVFIFRIASGSFAAFISFILLLSTRLVREASTGVQHIIGVVVSLISIVSTWCFYTRITLAADWVSVWIGYK